MPCVTVGYDPTLFHHDRAVAKVEYHLHIVRGDQRRMAETAYQVDDLPPGAGIEIRGRARP